MNRVASYYCSSFQKLEMVENLESKIDAERKDLHEKIDKMRKECNLYSDLNRLEESDELTRLYLSQMRERYVKRSDFLKTKVKEVSTDYERNKKMLKKSTTWNSLLELEDKLRRQAQVVFSLEEQVKAVERKTNYESSKDRCLVLTDEILLLKQ